MDKVFIIAEAGVNHNGNMELAYKLIDVAVQAGADAVKFQTFKAENIACRDAVKAEYQLNNTENDESQFDMLKKLELDYKMHKQLISYCGEKDIIFLSTPFDLESLDMLVKLGLEIYKIPSGEITNLPFLREVGALNKQTIISTGMSTLGEVEAALSVLLKAGLDRKKVTILHCNTEYPTPMEDVNLSAMNTLRHAFPGIKIGYSDHTAGLDIPIAATALGAVVIEKHFTLDRTMDGPDHKASLEPQELGQMVKAIRNIEQAMGDGIKQPSSSEMKNINIARKSIVASKEILAGELFSTMNITVKRPGHGISPMNWDIMMGRKAKRKFLKDEIIEF